MKKYSTFAVVIRRSPWSFDVRRSPGEFEFARRIRIRPANSNSPGEVEFADHYRFAWRSRIRRPLSSSPGEFEFADRAGTRGVVRGGAGAPPRLINVEYF